MDEGKSGYFFTLRDLSINDTLAIKHRYNIHLFHLYQRCQPKRICERKFGWIIQQTIERLMVHSKIFPDNCFWNNTDDLPEIIKLTGCNQLSYRFVPGVSTHKAKENIK
jgi:hypothetical protein